MALGSVRHDRNKVSKMKKAGTKTFTVKVTVKRSGANSNRGGFSARACITGSAHPGNSKYRGRCTYPEQADSPTSATKKALQALAKKLY